MRKKQKIDPQIKVKNRIKPGSVIKVFCNFTTPPKEKLIVVVTTDPRLKVALINSNVHQHILSKPTLLNLQLLLRSSDYPKFLKGGQSYLDASKFHDNINIEQLKSHLVNKPHKYRGKLLRTDVDELIKKISASPLYSKNERKIIKENFSKSYPD